MDIYSTIFEFFHSTQIALENAFQDKNFNLILFDEGFRFIARFTCLILIFFFSNLYITLRVFKVLCYTKLTFEWLPMINPYTWPFFFINKLTNFYFKFWSKNLPSLKVLKGGSVEISAIIALEALNSLLFFCIRFTNIIITYLQNYEKTL